MTTLLPSDLLEAENLILKSLDLSLRAQEKGRWTVTLKFEGLKILPISIRLSQQLALKGIDNILTWPDAGATALAKHSNADLKDSIYSFSDVIKDQNLINGNKVLIAVTPQPHDYEEFQNLAGRYKDSIIMLNGRLEDAAVGIGSVARDRRKGFVSVWRDSFWLEPINKGALMHLYPEEWSLFKEHDDGYRLQSTFSQKPNPEQIFEQLGLSGSS